MHTNQREGRLVDHPQPAGGKARDGATACHLSAGNILAAGGTERRHSEEGAGATRRGVQTTTVPGSRRCTPIENVTTTRVEQRAWSEDLRWKRQQQPGGFWGSGWSQLDRGSPRSWTTETLLLYFIRILMYLLAFIKWLFYMLYGFKSRKCLIWNFIQIL